MSIPELKVFNLIDNVLWSSANLFSSSAIQAKIYLTGSLLKYIMILSLFTLIFSFEKMEISLNKCFKCSKYSGLHLNVIWGLEIVPPSIYIKNRYSWIFVKLYMRFKIFVLISRFCRKMMFNLIFIGRVYFFPVCLKKHFNII